MVNIETTIYTGSGHQNSVIPNILLWVDSILRPMPGVLTIEPEFADLGSRTLLYIVQEAGLLVGSNIGVLVVLHTRNPSWTRSSPFLAGYPRTMSVTRVTV